LAKVLSVILVTDIRKNLKIGVKNLEVKIPGSSFTVYGHRAVIKERG